MKAQSYEITMAPARNRHEETSYVSLTHPSKKAKRYLKAGLNQSKTQSTDLSTQTTMGMV
jgi:hypothetical protein